MKPALSVIIPCYNCEEILEETIEAIVNQTFQSFELVIIDSGSTDKTLNIVRSFRDSRIKLIQLQYNFGDYSAINTGIDFASGKYICPINPGDIPLPNKFQVQFEYMESHRRVGCVGSSAIVIDKAGNELRPYSVPSTYKEIKCQLIKTGCILTSTLMLRKSLLTLYDLWYDDKYEVASGYEFLTRMVQYFPVTCFKEPLLRCREDYREITLDRRFEQKQLTDQVRLNYISSTEVKLNKRESRIYLAIMNGDYLFPKEVNEASNILNKIIEANTIKKRFNQHYLFNMLRLAMVKKYKDSKLGDWSIELALICFLEKIIPSGSRVLEFGSGMGTKALLRNYTVTSVEHNEAFCFSRSTKHTCIYAPIKGNWYAREVMKDIDFNYFDLLIVDGPVGDLRKGILQNLSLFNNMNTPVIFDDANRELDHSVIENFCKSLSYKHKIIKGDIKSFAYCFK